MTVETLDDFEPGKSGIVRRWLDELEMAGQWQSHWEDRSRKIVDIYSGKTQRSFNILHSNVETLRPNLFAHKPEPDVRRRTVGQSNADREAAEILERSIRYQDDTFPYEDNVIAATNDYMLTGRAVLRVRYTPTIVQRNEPLLELVDDGVFLTDGGNLVDPEDVQRDSDGNAFFQVEEVQFERADLEHWPYDDFRHHPAKRWQDCRWVAFRHYFNREGLNEAFGKGMSAKTQLTVEEGVQTQRSDSDVNPDIYRRAEVWEIWDKDARKILFVSPGNVECPLLEVDDGPDYYNLREFFPTPEPLRSIRTPNTLEPTPEYTLYQDLADELDDVTVRITEIVKTIDVRGACDGAVPELQQIFDSPNKIIPLEAWRSIQDKGGLENLLGFIPIEPQVKAFVALVQQRQELIQTIYQMIGLSDIARGSSDARETATAQKLKGDFGQLRLTPRQREWQRYLRDLMRLQAELIAEKFEPETLEKMSGMPVTPEVFELLRNDANRNFAIDIETDSTISVDQAKIVGDIKEMLEGLAATAEAAQALPESARGPFIRSIVRKLKLGREVEIALEEAEQSGQQEQPDGKVIEAQMKAQLEQAKLAQKEGESVRENETKNRELNIKEAEVVAKTIQGMA